MKNNERDVILLSFRRFGSRLVVVAVKPNMAPLKNEKQEGANMKGVHLKASKHVNFCFQYIR